MTPTCLGCARDAICSTGACAWPGLVVELHVSYACSAPSRLYATRAKGRKSTASFACAWGKRDGTAVRTEHWCPRMRHGAGVIGTGARTDTPLAVCLPGAACGLEGDYGSRTPEPAVSHHTAPSRTPQTGSHCRTSEAASCNCAAGGSPTLTLLTFARQHTTNCGSLVPCRTRACHVPPDPRVPRHVPAPQLVLYRDLGDTSDGRSSCPSDASQCRTVPTRGVVDEYANNPQTFLDDFADVFTKMMEVCNRDARGNPIRDPSRGGCNLRNMSNLPADDNPTVVPVASPKPCRKKRCPVVNDLPGDGGNATALPSPPPPKPCKKKRGCPAP